jgi:hypothetical protein
VSSYGARTRARSPSRRMSAVPSAPKRPSASKVARADVAAGRGGQPGPDLSPGSDDADPGPGGASRIPFRARPPVSSARRTRSEIAMTNVLPGSRVLSRLRARAARRSSKPRRPSRPASTPRCSTLARGAAEERRPAPHVPRGRGRARARRAGRGREAFRARARSAPEGRAGAGRARARADRPAQRFDEAEKPCSRPRSGRRRRTSAR